MCCDVRSAARKDKADSGINQFVIERLFRKYFEEEKEIVPQSPSSIGAPRNDSVSQGV